MYTFRPAIREKVGLLIGLVGCSGSGKTYTAMRLASGIVGKGKRFAVIDTEARRSLHYAGMFEFDMCEVKAPFRPEAYTEAIKAADEAGYEAIVVDSFSHEWAGEGGILDWQEHELDRMAGEDWKKRENCKMAAWIKPKMGHKQMIQRLLQVRANLILCFRAEEKVKMEKDANNKTVIVPIGWQPICSKEVPYEMTVSFLLTPDKPGYPHPLKLQEQHKLLFPLDRPINEESGRKVAEWAAGGITDTSSKPADKKDEIPEFSDDAEPSSAGDIVILYIEEIEKKEGINAKTKKPWTSWTLKVGNSKWGTFSGSIAALAESAKAEGKPVEVTYITKEFAPGKSSNEIVSLKVMDEG